ncbi:hypothetical protein L6R52_11710 [Myxococcota bacterium]|nr:hypothetical protein [Myxococcota bacterium]
MPPKSREQRLFGAACLKLTLERTHGDRAATLEIYEATLRDLDLTDGAVEEYLSAHRSEVQAALDARRGPRS